MKNVSADQVEPEHLLQNCFFIPDLSVATRDEALVALVHALSSCHSLLPEKDILRSVRQRERLRATGTPEGVAFPHGKYAGDAGAMYAVVATLRKPVDFGRDTAFPCRIVVLTISSAFHSDGHLCFLGFMARHLRQEHVRKRILEAKNKTELLGILSLA